MDKPLNTYCSELKKLLDVFSNVIEKTTFEPSAYREGVFSNTNHLKANFYYFQILKEYKTNRC